jgi:hypothetical protein
VCELSRPTADAMRCHQPRRSCDLLLLLPLLPLDCNLSAAAPARGCISSGQISVTPGKGWLLPVLPVRLSLCSKRPQTLQDGCCCPCCNCC